MAEYRGKLCIFMDEPGEQDSAKQSEGSLFAARQGDVFELRNPGDALWYQLGWAIGKNARGQYCSRTSASKIRTFETFSEAMDFVRRKRKARPIQSFYLVYEVDGRKSIVDSLEQIQRLDNHPAGQEHRTLNDLGQYPALEALTEKVGKIVATNALALLRTHAQQGEAAARESYSPATYERLWQVLQEASLVEGSAPA